MDEREYLTKMHPSADIRFEFGFRGPSQINHVGNCSRVGDEFVLREGYCHRPKIPQPTEDDLCFCQSSLGFQFSLGVHVVAWQGFDRGDFSGDSCESQKRGSLESGCVVGVVEVDC